MNHVDFNILYRLAELVDDEQPFNDEETEYMRHISDCKECYDKFISLISIKGVISDSGYIALSNIFNTGNDYEAKEEISKRVMAVISVVKTKIKNKVSVMMEQVEEVKEGLVFEKPFAVAARNTDENNQSELEKLEDIENEKNYVVVDLSSNELLVQIDTRDLKGKSVDIYIIQESGTKMFIPVERVGLLVKGKLSKIPDEQFKLYIEEN